MCHRGGESGAFGFWGGAGSVGASMGVEAIIPPGNAEGSGQLRAVE
jgi:hypothetical protein